MKENKRNTTLKSMILLCSFLLIGITVTGCTRDEGISFGTVGKQEVRLGDFAYELWDTNNSYIADSDYYRENYDIDVFEGEDITENIKDEAYNKLLRVYILADRAIEEGETLSTALQEDDNRRAKGILGELDAEFVSRYKINEKNLSRYLDYQSLAGIWFGKRIDELKVEAEKNSDDTLSENEIRLKAYELFEEEYVEMLSGADISLDDSLRNEVSLP